MRLWAAITREIGSRPDNSLEGCKQYLVMCALKCHGVLAGAAVIAGLAVSSALLRQKLLSLPPPTHTHTDRDRSGVRGTLKSPLQEFRNWQRYARAFLEPMCARDDLQCYSLELLGPNDSRGTSQEVPNPKPSSLKPEFETPQTMWESTHRPLSSSILWTISRIL